MRMRGARRPRGAPEPLCGVASPADRSVGGAARRAARSPGRGAMRLSPRTLCAAARAAWRESFPLEGRDVARWFPGHMAKGEARRGALLPRLLAGPALGGLVS